jgi:hypothetical protein
MTAEDWLDLSSAMDIGRRLRPELSDEERWQMLNDACAPAPKKVMQPDGSYEITEFKHPSGKWPVWTKWPFYYETPPTVEARLHWRPDVEKLFSSIGKSASRPAPKPAKQFRGSELRELLDLLIKAARETADGFLKLGDEEKLRKERYPNIPRARVRRAMHEAGIVTSKRGRR